MRFQASVTLYFVLPSSSRLAIGQAYDVAADGTFLIDTAIDDDAATPITLSQNWSPDIKE